jgi:hypothetical protein
LFLSLNKWWTEKRRCRLTHYAVPRCAESLIFFPVLEVLAAFIKDPSGEFEACEGHGRGRLLERSKSAVEIVADVPGFESSELTDFVEFSELNDHGLRAAVAKVKTDGFENHAFNAGHGSGGALEHLKS